MAPTTTEHGAPPRGGGGAAYSDTPSARRNEGWGRSPEEGAGAAMVGFNFAAPALSFGFLWFFLGKERTLNNSILLIETTQLIISLPHSLPQTKEPFPTQSGKRFLLPTITASGA